MSDVNIVLHLDSVIIPDGVPLLAVVLADHDGEIFAQTWMEVPNLDEKKFKESFTDLVSYTLANGIDDALDERGNPAPSHEVIVEVAQQGVYYLNDVLTRANADVHYVNLIDRPAWAPAEVYNSH